MWVSTQVRASVLAQSSTFALRCAAPLAERASAQTRLIILTFSVASRAYGFTNFSTNSSLGSGFLNTGRSRPSPALFKNVPDATGRKPGEAGGKVTVLGEKVGLLAGATLDASGAAGGGQVLVGGNRLGQGPEHNASAVYVDQQTTIRADIAETLTCAYMAAATLAGAALNLLVGWWWAEYAAALALLVFIAMETREAVEAARS